MRCPALAAAALLTSATAAPSQRVALEPGGHGPNALEQLVETLALPDKRPAAMDKLWLVGAPAVPQLATVVARGGDAAVPALQLLALLGGRARPAVPQLQRLLQAGGHRCQHEIEFALAAIGERDTVLVADYRGFVIEFDADGKELRRVKHPWAWGVQPLAGDRLLVAADALGVEEIDWTGKVFWSAKPLSGGLDARRLIDGTTVVACWGASCVIGLDAAGKELWRIAGVNAIDVEPLPNGNFLVAGHDDRVVLEANSKGEVVWKLSLADSPMDVDLLPDGNLLVTMDKARRIVELDRRGHELRSLSVEQDPEDSQRLPDGRTFVAWGDGAALLDPTGKVIWRYKGSQCGRVVARIGAAPGGR